MIVWTPPLIILLLCFVLIGSLVLALSWCRSEDNHRKRKVTFNDEETSVVEIDEDSRDYGTSDAGPSGGPSKEQDDNVSISNINIEKAEALMLPERSDGEQSETGGDDDVRIKENSINLKLEKEALDSIKDQTSALDKIQSEKSSESRFSFMKYLKKDKKDEDAGTSSKVEDNGLPSYSEAMDSLPPEPSEPSTSVTFADGATQTNLDEPAVEEEEEVKEEAKEEKEGEDEKPERFRFFRFRKS